MHLDLLTNPIFLAYAVNCEIEQDHIVVGAIYLAPDISEPEIPLVSGETKVTAVLPEELIRKSEPMRAWNIKLPLQIEEGNPPSPS